MSSPLEAAVRRAVPFLAAGIGVSPLLLAVPGRSDRLVTTIAHLSVLVALSLALAFALAPLAEASWFEDLSWKPASRRLAGGIALVVIVTGVTGLVTLASSAALRLQPSLQFLQLLSALDIAWAAGAAAIGGHLLWSPRGGRFAGGAIGVACVLSIWNYLRVVGFTPDGGWLLDGADLLRLVIPADMAAAAFAGTVLVLGARRFSRN